VSDYKQIIETEIKNKIQRAKFNKDTFTIAHVAAATVAVK
jgi:hypothetical protein